MARAKVITLILQEGSPNKETIATMSNRPIKAIKIPRTDINTCDSEELEDVGVYLLFCKEENNKDSVYIGESENVKKRLLQHIRDYNAEKEQYYWHTAVVITSDELTKTKIRYLESKFVDICKICNRYDCLTKSRHRNTKMSKADLAIIDEIIDDAKLLVNTLGYKIFEPLVETDAKTGQIKTEVLRLEVKDGLGLGIYTSEGFVLLKGSKIRKELQSSVPDNIISLREEYKDKITSDNITTEDILFNNPSPAAAFVSGTSISGPANWRNSKGFSINELGEEFLINNENQEETYNEENTDFKPNEIVTNEDIEEDYTEDIIISNEVKEEINAEKENNDNSDILYLIRPNSNINAKGKLLGNKLLVLKGSKIRTEVMNSAPKGAKELRQKYADKIINNTITVDILCKSPSEAGGFVTGVSTNGKTAWVNKDKVPLKYLNESENSQIQEFRTKETKNESKKSNHQESNENLIKSPNNSKNEEIQTKKFTNNNLKRDKIEYNKPKKEENAIILDYLKLGYFNPNKSKSHGKPIAQAIGVDKFTLIELTPKEGIDLNLQDCVYIGSGKRDKINRVKGLLNFKNLTGTSKIELEYAIKDIILSNEDKFIGFFNEARNPNGRVHRLDLIPGINKNTMIKIHNESKKYPFKDFEDLSKRVPIMKDPAKMIANRVIFELDESKKDRANKKFYLFT